VTRAHAPLPPRPANGITASVSNRVFEAALMLALNPGTVVTTALLREEMGLSRSHAEQVCRSLCQGQLAERIARGQYAATVTLTRMVALWTPKDGPC